MLRQRARFFRTLLIVCDGLLVGGAVVASFHVRFHHLEQWLPPRNLAGPARYAEHGIPFVAAVAVMLLAFGWCGVYRPRRDQRFAVELGQIRGCTDRADAACKLGNRRKNFARLLHLWVKPAETAATVTGIDVGQRKPLHVIGQ